MDYVIKGRGVYPTNGTPYIWDISPSLNSPIKVLQYESYLKNNSDWKLCDTPYMDIDFSYWYIDKNLDKIRLSLYNLLEDVRTILDGEQQENYSAIIISEF